MATGGSRRRLAFLSGAPRVSTTTEAAVSGARTHVLGVIQGFERLGWEVRPFILGDLPAIRRIASIAREGDFPSLWARMSADLARLLLAAMTGRWAFRQVGLVDWAYERYGAFQALGRSFQRRGIPWILETNSVIFSEGARDRRSLALVFLEKALELRAYRQADVVLCPSESLRRLLVEFGVAENKVLVVQNAADPDRFHPDVSPSWSMPSPVIGFAGTLYRWMGIDILIRAVAELHAEGLHYNVLIVGDGEKRAEWESLVRALGLGDRVHFVGRVPGEAVPGYLAGVDICYAGHVPLSVGAMYHSPLKLYEYMSMAKPVIASDFADAKQLVLNGLTGYLFEAGNVDDLKRALRQAYEQRGRWGEMGAKARDLVLRNHTWDARLRETIPAIESLLEARYGTPYPARRHG